MQNPSSVFAVWWFVRADIEVLTAFTEEIRKPDVELMLKPNGSEYSADERAKGLDGDLALTDEAWELIRSRLAGRFGNDCIIRVEQRAGQAVRVIPGWLHQVNTLLPCFKFALEAVYAQEVSEVAFANQCIAKFGAVPDYTAFPARFARYILDEAASWAR